jgi:hypothetical protein
MTPRDPRGPGLPLAAVILMLGGCSGSTEPSAPPVLSVPVVDLTAVESFIPFGAALPGSGVLNPAYELVVADTARDVFAATGGTVSRIIRNSQGDYELHIRPLGSRGWLVIYDHVLAPVVAEGQTIEPGAVLGRIGLWSESHGRIELQINREDDSICPRALGTPGFNAAHEATFASLDQDPSWTSVCLSETVRP